MSARILHAMVRVYEQCRAYRDRGEIRLIVQSDAKEERPTHLQFETAFVRPDRFSFKMRDGNLTPNSPAVCAVEMKNGASHFFARAGAASRVTDTLDLAIASATGISMGAAHIVPRMLMPTDISGSSMYDIRDLSNSELQMIDDSLCDHVTGNIPGISEMHLWIDKRTHLLRRASRTLRFDDGQYQWLECARQSLTVESRRELESRSGHTFAEAFPATRTPFVAEIVISYYPDMDISNNADSLQMDPA